MHGGLGNCTTYNVLQLCVHDSERKYEVKKQAALFACAIMWRVCHGKADLELLNLGTVWELLS
jgi:hypothetical protein